MYIDDIIIIRSATQEIDTLVKQLHSEFSLKDIYFLGVEVTHLSNVGLHLCQLKYVFDLLDRCNMENAKPVHTPMVSSSLLSKTMSSPIDDPSEYCILAGTLQYVMLTRLDIAYAVNRICQFMHAPTDVHFVAIKRNLRYLCTTIDHGLLLSHLSDCL